LIKDTCIFAGDGVFYFFHDMIISQKIFPVKYIFAKINDESKKANVREVAGKPRRFSFFLQLKLKVTLGKSGFIA